MPKITDDLNAVKTPHGYQFSCVGADELEASEYTLVTIVQDASGSVFSFHAEMIDCLKTILQACQKSPRSENLMLRTSVFDDNVNEFFGFRLLNDIEPDEFDGIFNGTGGCTALFDSTHTSIDATLTYGKQLTKQGITNNAIIFIVTDGMDNASTFGAKEVQKIVAEARKNEEVESVLVVLIGITDNNADLNSYLEHFKTEADIDQYVNIGDADESTLAKLADFISRSVSSQSQSLGTGGASSILTF